MPARLRLTLVVVAVCALAALAGVVLLGARGGSGEAASDPTPTGLHGALRPAGLRAPDFRLRDQHGRLATMRAYRGRLVIVTFMYSTCRDTCPLTAQQIRGALDLLGHDVPLLAITVDPVGDTPANVRRFLVEERMTRRMRYLTGTAAQLAPVWRAYGVQPETSGSEHTASTVVDDGSGRQRVGYLTDQLTPEGLSADLRALSDGARVLR